MPAAAHYNLTFEQQLGRKAVFAVAYVGTQGRHLLRFTTPNLGPASTIAPSSLTVFQEEFPVPEVLGRVVPPSRSAAGVGAIYQFETTANSSYNALQLELRGRSGTSLQYRAAYTLSKAVDDVSDVFDLAGARVLPQNSVTFSGERGPANFDSRHRFSFSAIYSVTKAAKSHSAWRRMWNGLELAGIVQASSGQPFTVNSIFDVNLDGNLTDRLNSTTGLVVTGNARQPLRLSVDPATLLAPVGQDGTVGRNTFRAGGLFEMDFSAARTIAIKGRHSLIVRADIFNITNQANFGIPVRYLEAPSFGKATSTVTPGRRVQFELKYSF
jgi:hypothetical protein